MPVSTALASAALVATLPMAIVTQDQVSLRATPHENAQQQAQLWQGDFLEVRGERLDYLQVYDHRGERAGFIHQSQIQRVRLTPESAPELLSTLRFLRHMPGQETLGLAYSAAWLKAAPAQEVNGSAGNEVLDIQGQLAERLALRATPTPNAPPLSKYAETRLAAHLEVANSHDVRFLSFERHGQIQVCYDAQAYLTLMARPAPPEQKAHAALALTRPECIDPHLSVTEQAQLATLQADVLNQVPTDTLPTTLKNRIAIHKANTWSRIAYGLARQNKPAHLAAQNALNAIGAVVKTELPDEDQPRYNDAAMRANTIRFAAIPNPDTQKPLGQSLTLALHPGEPGETCFTLTQAKTPQPLLSQCTYAQIWLHSASLNREGNAIALAVQPTESWQELWLLRKTSTGWVRQILPPANLFPDIGYIEFAGWVPGGEQMLIAREARAEGKYKHNFEVVNLDSAATVRQSSDPTQLGPFSRWQDPGWKNQTLSLR